MLASWLRSESKAELRRSTIDPPSSNLDLNWSRLRKLMKLSPGPVSVHPSHASCGAGRRQSSVTGCEAKPSAVEMRNSMILFPNEVSDGCRK
eukprot:scaffold81034_cov70-Phaeocystis_antarctica.AAC.1